MPASKMGLKFLALFLASRLRLACRQWRRVLLGTLIVASFAVLTDQLEIEETNPDIFHGPIGWLTLALTGLIISASLTLVFALVSPMLLNLIEIWSIALLVAAALQPAFDQASFLGEYHSLAGFLLLFATFLLVNKLLYGDGLIRFPLTRPWSRRRSIRLTSDRNAIWHALRPDPSRPQDHFWPATTFLPADKDAAPDFIMIRPRRAGYKDEAVAITVEDETPLENLTFVSRPANPNDMETPTLRLSVSLAPSGKGRTLLCAEQTILSSTLGQRFNWWLSNDLTDYLHCIRARIENRADGSLHGSQMNPHRKRDRTQQKAV